MSRLILSLMVAVSLSLAGCAMMHHEKEDEGNETKVKFDQLPAAVKQTFQKESNNAAIAEVDQETEAGKTEYEADVILDGKNWEIKVAQDGGLISKKLDDEKDEKDEKKNDKK